MKFKFGKSKSTKGKKCSKFGAPVRRNFYGRKSTSVRRKSMRRKSKSVRRTRKSKKSRFGVPIRRTSRFGVPIRRTSRFGVPIRRTSRFGRKHTRKVRRNTLKSRRLSRKVRRNTHKSRRFGSAYMPGTLQSMGNYAPAEMNTFQQTTGQSDFQRTNHYDNIDKGNRSNFYSDVK